MSLECDLNFFWIFCRHGPSGYIQNLTCSPLILSRAHESTKGLTLSTNSWLHVWSGFDINLMREGFRLSIHTCLTTPQIRHISHNPTKLELRHFEIRRLRYDPKHVATCYRQHVLKVPLTRVDGGPYNTCWRWGYNTCWCLIHVLMLNPPPPHTGVGMARFVNSVRPLVSFMCPWCD